MEEELLKAEATTKRGGVKNNASKYVVVSVNPIHMVFWPKAAQIGKFCTFWPSMEATSFIQFTEITPRFKAEST